MYTRYKKEKRFTRKLFWDKVVGVSRSALSGSWVFVFTLVVVAFGLSATFNAASVCVLAFLIPRTTCRVDATSTLQLASEIVWQVANYCVIDKLERCVIEAMHKQINKLNKSKTQKKRVFAAEIVINVLKNCAQVQRIEKIWKNRYRYIVSSFSSKQP